MGDKSGPDNGAALTGGRKTITGRKKEGRRLEGTATPQDWTRIQCVDRRSRSIKNRRSRGHANAIVTFRALFAMPLLFLFTGNSARAGSHASECNRHRRSAQTEELLNLQKRYCNGSC
jgi:hypothetical protein